MANLEEIELHDALLISMNIDYVTKVVTIGVEFYKGGNDRDRRTALISFEGVESMSQISDMDRLQENIFADNVNYWLPAQHGGVTYIYLVHGCVAIKEKKVRIDHS
jgi:hypothetical protein